jgi:hypothetical protein
MEIEIAKVYSPEAIEPRWARYWVERELYRAGDDATRPRFCLVLPLRTSPAFSTWATCWSTR